MTIGRSVIFVNANMKSDVEELHSVLAALADPTRIRILGLLAKGEVCVCHLHDALRIPQPKASRHLAYLRRAGVVVADKRGLWVHYRLADANSGAAGTLLSAVRSIVSKLDVVKRDSERLERALCCAPEAARSRRRPASTRA